MALSNYTELKAAIASWLHRDDLTSEIIDFITLAEKRINRALESRLSETRTTLTATVSSRFVFLPSGFYNHIGLWLTTYEPRNQLTYWPPNVLPVQSSNGQPYYFTIDGGNVAFDCPADQAYTFDFRYKKGYDIATDSTNDVLTRYPSLYLYGALLEAAIFREHDQDAIKYKVLFAEALNEAGISENRDKSRAVLPTDGFVQLGKSNILNGGYY